ncbi:MAG: hypothetical protein EXS03_07690 [Phycisphaerales bacterium]|nr:hypothetical protein [Phycisphaerales bacterium]
MLTLLIAALLVGCQSGAPAPVPAPAPLPPPALAPTSAIDALLDRMEAQGKSMKDFVASATVEKTEALTDEKEIRRGRIVVEGPVGPSRRIAVVIDEYIDATGRGSPDSRRFIFSRGWLDEFDATRKQWIHRQLARDGELVDPLRVGEGPFPLPLGQPKADVLREFIVTPAPLPDAPFFKTLAPRATELVAISMAPRAGTAMARDTETVIAVVDRQTLAPVAVEVRAVNGDRTRALFRGGRLDAGLDEEARALLAPPSTDGWARDDRPLK